MDGTETEHIGWPDHEPGIQIYEKTTEDVPFARRRKSLLLMAGVTFIISAICFLFGFFIRDTHSNCVQQAVS